MAAKNPLCALGWAPALFTGAKSFRDNPLIGSARLNRLGLHKARVLAAHRLAAWRQYIMLPYMPAAERRTLADDGYIVIPGYLSADQIEAMRAELPLLAGQAREMRQGDTLTQRMLLSDAATAKTPRIRELVKDTALNQRLMYVEAKAHLPLIYLQHIRNGAVDAGREDPQKTLHSDTFHPTMKAWLYMQDVTEDMGPLRYVPGSHRLDGGRLQFEYDRSLVARRQPDRYSEKGSFRLRDGDSGKYGFADPVKLTVRAGSLVIANTFGFHGRSPAAAGASRMEIFAYGRTWPFAPWSGWPSEKLLRLEQAVVSRYWDYKGRKAAAAGRRATWHAIATQDMIA